RYISPNADAEEVVTVTGMGAKRADVRLLETAVRLPWAGHYGLHAIPEIYQEIKKTETAIIFVNTR
ncbi:MAG TPA: hypothetical protein DCL95_16400, partial [Rhodospirillaceae bacterium]|nr:hypothetical protein [Rhodospirillaceae bacterium]